MSNNQPAKKGVGALDFFCIGFGSIVGVGWAVSINGWMANSGGPVPAGLGYLLVLVMMVPISLCYCELVPALPVAGGGSAFALLAFNDKIGALSGWMAWCGMVAIVPWEALQITDILSYLIPSLNEGRVLYTVLGSDVRLIAIIIGAAFSVLLFLLNKRGLAAAAAFQKVLCFILIITAIIGGVAAIIGGSTANWQPIYDVTNPEIYGEGGRQVFHRSMFGGMLGILTSAPFFLVGFETIPQGVEEAGGDIKSVGKTVMLSIVLACVFYTFLLFAFGCGWHWQDFVGMNRPAAATMFTYLFPGAIGKALFWMITIGAIAGLFTTWNGFFMACALLLMAMARGKMMPAVFAKQDKNGVPMSGLILILILSLIGPFAGANMIENITCCSGTAIVVSWFLTSCSFVKLRFSRPDLNRPYMVPAGKFLGIFASLASGVVLVLLFIPGSPAYMGNVALVMWLVWLVIGIVLYLVVAKDRKGMSREDLLHGVFGNLTQKL